MFSFSYESIYFEITAFCNRNCPYCYNDSNVFGDYLPKEVIYEMLNECKHNHINHITISGGEGMYIDYYNNCRSHRCLNFKSPTEIEATYYAILTAQQRATPFLKAFKKVITSARKIKINICLILRKKLLTQ